VDQTSPEPAAIESLSFDDALGELQRTVAELEAGGQPLEVTIALYERGVALEAHCERLLRDAQLRVQQLVGRAGGALEARDVDPSEDQPGADG
jgi:exodeoxyribonuclease VII small subunit